MLLSVMDSFQLLTKSGARMKDGANRETRKVAVGQREINVLKTWESGKGQRKKGGGGRETPPLPKAGAVPRRMLSLGFTCMLPECGQQYKNQTDETEIIQKNREKHS